jgi:hypothetical protein
MKKETRYVLCDSCGRKIYLGSEVYCFDGYCGVYCSAECYADAHATVKVLDEEEADNCGCDILDDDAIEKEKANIQKEISELQNKLKRLETINATEGTEND